MKLSKPTSEAIENMKSLADMVREARETARAAIIVGRPEGAVSIQEYADGPPKMGRSTAREQLNKAVAAGIMEKMEAVIANHDGKPVKIRFYRKVKR